MQTAFLEAVVNRDHQLLGRALHPLSLSDALFLTLADNPLWTGGREPELEDIEEAALICSLQPERLLLADLAPRGFLERLRFIRWKKRNLQREQSAEIDAWIAYRDDFDSRPDFWDGAAGGRSLTAPWVLSLASFIEMHSNMREREIMTAPIGLMFWKAAAIAERLGTSAAEIMSEEEIEIGREQAAALAAAGETFPEADDIAAEGGA